LPLRLGPLVFSVFSFCFLFHLLLSLFSLLVSLPCFGPLSGGPQHKPGRRSHYFFVSSPPLACCVPSSALVVFFLLFFPPGGLLHKQGPRGARTHSGRSAPVLAQHTGGNLLLLAGGPREGAGAPSQHQAPTSVQ
jgi:hypothetical protein